MFHARLRGEGGRERVEHDRTRDCRAAGHRFGTPAERRSSMNDNRLMRVAYHFDADSYALGREPDGRVQLFEAVLAAIPTQRRHVRIRLGDLVLQLYVTGDDLIAVARALAIESRRAWRTVDLEQFVELAATTNIVIAELLGLTLRDAQELDEALEQRFGGEYFGAVEVDVRVGPHWVLYEQSLPDRYRIVGNELRLLHTSEQLEADPQIAERDEWRESQLFGTVDFEDIGVQKTLFDPYTTREHILRDAELEDLVGSQFGAVVNETLLRTRDLDPRLNEALHAAFGAADRSETAEQLAQVALSCRRFVERLADSLFPARDDVRKGRKLGRAEYRNRLWAYVEDHLSGRNRELVLASLEDVGNRIDALDACVQRGVHGDELTASELQRILVSLVGVTYDILTLAPPPLTQNLDAYETHLRSILREILEQSRDE